MRPLDCLVGALIVGAGVEGVLGDSASHPLGCERELCPQLEPGNRVVIEVGVQRADHCEVCQSRLPPKKEVRSTVREVLLE